jgi:hypothetical protein
MNYNEEYALKQHEARCNSYRDSNKATIEFSKMALRGAFILNGSAAVAIIYSNTLQFYASLELFAIGALSTVIASGATYVVQYLITLTWRDDLYKNPTDEYRSAVQVGQMEISHRGISVLRGVAVALVVVSYLMFALGLVSSHSHLKKEGEERRIKTSMEVCIPAK